MAALALSAPLGAQCQLGQYACCLTTTTYYIQCGTGYCEFTTCSGGYDNEEDQFEDECVVCNCGVFQSWFPDGSSCYNVSPEKQPASPDAAYGAEGPALYAYVRACGGSYALVRIGRPG